MNNDSVHSISYVLPVGAPKPQREYVEKLLRQELGKELVEKIQFGTPHLVEIWEEHLPPIFGETFPTERLEIKARISQVDRRYTTVTVMETIRLESWLFQLQSKLRRWWKWLRRK